MFDCGRERCLPCNALLDLFDLLLGKAVPGYDGYFHRDDPLKTNLPSLEHYSHCSPTNLFEQLVIISNPGSSARGEGLLAFSDAKVCETRLRKAHEAARTQFVRCIGRDRHLAP